MPITGLPVMLDNFLTVLSEENKFSSYKVVGGQNGGTTVVLRFDAIKHTASELGSESGTPRIKSPSKVHRDRARMSNFMNKRESNYVLCSSHDQTNDKHSSKSTSSSVCIQEFASSTPTAYSQKSSQCASKVCQPLTASINSADDSGIDLESKHSDKEQNTDRTDVTKSNSSAHCVNQTPVSHNNNDNTSGSRVRQSNIPGPETQTIEVMAPSNKQKCESKQNATAQHKDVKDVSPCDSQSQTGQGKGAQNNETSEATSPINHKALFSTEKAFQRTCDIAKLIPQDWIDRIVSEGHKKLMSNSVLRRDRSDKQSGPMTVVSTGRFVFSYHSKSKTVSRVDVFCYDPRIEEFVGIEYRYWDKISGWPRYTAENFPDRHELGELEKLVLDIIDLLKSVKKSK